MFIDYMYFYIFRITLTFLSHFLPVLWFILQCSHGFTGTLEDLGKTYVDNVKLQRIKLKSSDICMRNL